ncbi:MAG: recombination protein RecR [Clostridiales bacterium]|nr:recombination protein RecR [Clostridiales bacterium]MBR6483814.1 recombination protein RecR [Clostridiales bacterium]
MARYSPSIQDLINRLGALPGIGAKSATRVALHILNMPEEDAKGLSDSIINARKNTFRCSVCQNLTDSDPCPICSDPSRDKTTVCVVESPRDILTMERIHEYKGLYHVLHGVYDPAGGKAIADITLNQLIERLTLHPEINEVIMATNPTIEGNATALYVSRLLSNSGIKITRLASGLPLGSELEFSNDYTLTSAFKGRVDITS